MFLLVMILFSVLALNWSILWLLGIYILSTEPPSSWLLKRSAPSGSSPKAWLPHSHSSKISPSPDRIYFFCDISWTCGLLSTSKVPLSSSLFSPYSPTCLSSQLSLLAPHSPLLPYSILKLNLFMSLSCLHVPMTSCCPFDDIQSPLHIPQVSPSLPPPIQWEWDIKTLVVPGLYFLSLILGAFNGTLLPPSPFTSSSAWFLLIFQVLL